jgi:hypothetical protein
MQRQPNRQSRCDHRHHSAVAGLITRVAAVSLLLGLASQSHASISTFDFRAEVASVGSGVASQF